MGTGACTRDEAPAAPPPPPESQDAPLGRLSLPEDLVLVDQRGEPVHVQRDLMQGGVVVMNFIFTRCTTICPPMGMGFSRLQEQLGARAGRDVKLVSVSLDPEHDTPERLAEWGKRYGAGPGWTLLSGSKQDVDRLLKAMTVYTPAKEQHAPIVLVGNTATGEWVRAHGLGSPKRLLEAVERALASAPPKSPVFTDVTSPARRYFSDTELVDQDGRKVRFYSDLIQGKTVIINVFFSRCTGSCPVMAGTFTRLQAHLGDRLGKDVRMLSISVDPERDTPERLKEYAQRFKARPGWSFLTGDKEHVQAVLQKLGQAVEDPNQHKALFLIGNDRTGLWKKAFGLAKADEVIPVVDSVMNDQGVSLAENTP
nr:SCO family protein [Pyxidicoccus fallax]